MGKPMLGRMRRIFIKRLLPILFWFCLLLGALAVYREVTPRVQGDYLILDGVKRELSMPLRILAEGSHLIFGMYLETGAGFPSRYVLAPNACIDRAIVNGTAVELPSCTETHIEAIEIGHLLISGRNHLIVEVIQDTPEYIYLFHIQPSARDPVTLAASLFILFAIVGLGVSLFPSFPRWGVELHLIFIGGVLLRTFYTLHTHFSERGPDWFGHLQYIQYVSEHWHIPPWEMGWEAYQPPLYYFVGAIWLRIADLILPFEEAISSLQIMSLLLSILTLFLAFLIGQKLCRTPRDRILFGALVSVFPGFVYIASRINNDTLVTLSMFATFWLLLRFWESGKRRDMLLAFFVCSLGVITKMNAALLLPLIGTVLILRRGTQAHEKIDLILRGSLIVLAIVGWYVIFRFYLEGTELVANADYLHQTIHLPNTWRHLTWFRPWNILLDPMIQTWGVTMRANGFLEYYFRSALGGFPMAYSSFAILIPEYLLGFLLIPLGLGGLIKHGRDRSTLPVLLALVIFLLLHMVFRLAYPYAPSQDYRYTPLLLVPFAYYVIRSTKYAGHLEKFSLALVWIFVGFSVALPLSIIFAF